MDRRLLEIEEMLKESAYPNRGILLRALFPSMQNMEIKPREEYTLYYSHVISVPVIMNILKTLRDLER